MKKKKERNILRKEIKTGGSWMQPTRSVGGIPSGDWMTEFPTVVRLLNGFMEGLARGRGGISEDTKAGEREDDWKCEKFSLNVAGRG